MWLVWPLAGLALAVVIALGVLARRRALATTPRLLVGAAAALLPIVVAPLAALGLWQMLLMIRPRYGNLALGDPYRPELYRWALGALTVTILLAWYLALRRRIGPESMAIGALFWPAPSARSPPGRCLLCRTTAHSLRRLPGSARWSRY